MTLLQGQRIVRAGQDHGAGPKVTADAIFKSVSTGDVGGAGTRWKGNKTHP